MTMVLRGLFILILVGVAALGGAAYYLSGLLLFRDKPRSDWETSKAPACSPWLVETAYADLRPGAAPKAPIDLTCDEATRLPREDFRVKAAHGMEIHYAAYQPAPTLPPTAPLFLHVHGVSGNTLHGARYLKMAERLGFRLVAMDLSNHGESQRDGRGAAYGCREDADVAAVVEDLLARYPGRDLYLHASSMGAMALVNALPRVLAADVSRRVVAVSLENPISSVRDIVMRSPHRPPVPDLFIDLGLAVASWRAGVNFAACRPIDSARDARLPVLVQWSEKDDLVPRSMVDEFFAALPQAAPARLEIFPGGGHSAVWNGDPVRYEEQTLANWREGLRKRAGSAALP